MPFNDLSKQQQKFLKDHFVSGQAIAAKAASPSPTPNDAQREIWLAQVDAFRDRIETAPDAFDVSKIKAALTKTERTYAKKFDTKPAEKALSTIEAAFAKGLNEVGGETAISVKRLEGLKDEFKSLQKLKFPEKKRKSADILDDMKNAAAKIKEGEFQLADRAMDQAEADMASARLGLDAKAAKDLKPADLKVLLKTQEGRAKLDAIVNNLNDDVPPKVMMNILEARFGAGVRIVQDATDRDSGMMDKAKHGAMLDTDSPKLKKYYKKLIDQRKADAES